jgi:hypothetical protein
MGVTLVWGFRIVTYSLVLYNGQIGDLLKIGDLLHQPLLLYLTSLTQNQASPLRAKNRDTLQIRPPVARYIHRQLMEARYTV